MVDFPVRYSASFILPRLILSVTVVFSVRMFCAINYNPATYLSRKNIFNVWRIVRDIALPALIHTEALQLFTRMMNVSRPSSMALRVDISRISLAAESNSNRLMDTLLTSNRFLVVFDHGSPIQIHFTRTPHPLAGFCQDSQASGDRIAPSGFQ